jgi:hypothetical protein
MCRDRYQARSYLSPGGRRFRGTATRIAGWPCAEYDGIVAWAACERFERSLGVSSMMVILVIAGIGFLLAGLLAIGFGIPVKEFSFGNTLILTGTVAACTGMILLGLWMVVRELKRIARRLSPGVATEDAGLFGPDRQPAAEHAGDAEPSVDDGSRDRVRSAVPAAPEPGETAPAAKPRRNLLFSSLSRRERERAQARTADPSAPDPRPPPAAAPVASESGELPSATFDDAWPKSERSRAADVPPRRSGRAASTEASADAAGPERQAPAGRKQDQPPVTVLKSGVVDGMAYSLYSDGSIEAQMPEGMMRFASIDELRAHLDQRP